MKGIQARKMILLSSVAVLLVVYILQLAFSGRNNVKVIAVEEKIDSVVIDNGGKKLSVYKEGDAWFVGEEKMPCQENRANGIVNAINEIKVLGNVDAVKNADDERYGLDDGIKVEAFASGVLVRSLVVGKNTATGSQCYVRVDDKKSVSLVQGALRTTFEATAEDIVEKQEEKTEAEEKPAL